MTASHYGSLIMTPCHHFSSSISQLFYVMYVFLKRRIQKLLVSLAKFKCSSRKIFKTFISIRTVK